jgi:hypothetical protein
MELILVTITVETRPQYGTSERMVIGVFDNENDKAMAIIEAERKYARQRYVVKESKINLNERLDS